MNSLRQMIQQMFYLLFGDFNGIQVFLYPMTLFWWIDSDSFLLAVTGLLTNQRHMFPLSLFLLLVLFMAFITVKVYSSTSGSQGGSAAEQRAFRGILIDLHKVILIALVAASLIYLLASFLNYYYGIQLPLKKLYPLLFRASSIFLVFYLGLRNIWTQPYRGQGNSSSRACRSVRWNMTHDPLGHLAHALAVLMLAILASFLFNQVVLNLLFPLLEAGGIRPKLMLLRPVGIFALLYDVFVFGVAFLLSNLLFSPLGKLLSRLALLLAPKLIHNVSKDRHA